MGDIRVYTLLGVIFAGGLVGESESGNIKDSYATGDVVVNGSSGCIGGLVGVANNTLIKDCRASGDARPISSADYVYAGGLVGSSSYCSIQYSHASGAIKGHCAGGLVGQDNHSKTLGSYAQGKVTMLTVKGLRSYVGGFIGEYCGNYVWSSYFNMKTTGQSKAIGYKIGSRATVTGYNSLGFVDKRYPAWS